VQPADLPDAALAMMSRRALATLTTLRADGSPHVVPVGFTYEPSDHTVRVIASDGTQKVHNAQLRDDRVERAVRGAGGPRGVVCQVDGPHWISLEGPIRVERDPEAVVDATQRYARRYQEPRENPRRVVLVIDVDRVLGRFPAVSDPG
jgi:F420H(2)-dependent biliverdin reductase